MRILIGASSQVVREGLESLLGVAPTFNVVGSFSVGRALARIEDLQPDVLLLDLESPADDSVLLAMESEAKRFISSIVVLTDSIEDSWSVDALRSGVRAILPRDATSEEIGAAIQATATGLVVLHPDALHSLLFPMSSGEVPEEPETDLSDHILTPREIEVLRMMAEGLGTKRSHPG